MSPRGAFAEEFNIQLGHVRGSAEKAPPILARPEVLTCLQLNAWRLVRRRI